MTESHRIVVRGPHYGSDLDEATFFEWLERIPCVDSVGGELGDVHIELKAGPVDDASLHELLALFHRYRLDLSLLARFETPQNRSWFAVPGKYWYDGVFRS